MLQRIAVRSISSFLERGSFVVEVRAVRGSVGHFPRHAIRHIASLLSAKHMGGGAGAREVQRLISNWAAAGLRMPGTEVKSYVPGTADSRSLETCASCRS